MKIKKKLLLLLFLSNICFSQNKNFKLIYEQFQQEQKYANKTIPSKKTDIIVMGNNSYVVSTTPKIVYFKEENTSKEGLPSGKTVGLLKRIIFKDFKKNEYLIESDAGILSYLTKGDLYFFKWTLTNESKIINGYECKKAISNTKYNQSAVCWYTDEIGITAAPENLDGIPGTVILAHKNHGARKLTFTLKKISYPKKIDFPKPNMKLRIYPEKEVFGGNFKIFMQEEVDDEFKH